MPRRHLEDLAELARLAVPVVLSRAGMMGLQLVDAMIVGRMSSRELAFQSIGFAPVITLVVASTAFMMGTLVVVAEAHGAGRDASCGAAWRRSLPWVAVLGLAACVLCLSAEALLLALGQEAELARGGGEVAAILGLSVPGMLLFSTSTAFLEGLKRPLPGLAVMAAANVVNLALNLVFVPGDFGPVPGGAAGSAIATTLTRTLMGIALAAYVWWLPDRERFGVRAKPSGDDLAAARTQRRVGTAAALSGAIEDSGFTILTFVAGWLGALAVAAFVVGLNLAAVIFMVALGIGTATAVRVGFARGQGAPAAAARAGWLGLGLNTAIMGLCGLVLAAAPAAVVALFSGDAGLVAMAAPALVLLAWIMPLDGGQVVMASALRGLGDTWVPTALHTISYVFVMGPLGWLLAIPFGLGVPGLFLGMGGASAVSVSVLAARFAVLSRR